ncbi:MAG: hypothetical protein V4660_05450 [Pseudomonadota bacterium]
MITRIACIFLLILLDLRLANAQIVVTSRNEAGNRYLNYYTDLIKLALEKTRPEYGDYRMEEIEPVETVSNLNLILQNTQPNLVVELTYDKQLSANGDATFIDIPIDGGSLGYRVCFINPRIKNELKKVSSFADLRKYTFVHGVGWADTEILRHNGLKVIEVPDFESTHKMLIAGRVDLFCRGAHQLKDDADYFKLYNKIAIDETFVLFYVLPRFFYLNSKNILAKKRIAAGMELAFKDGSLKQLWLKYNKKGIDLVNRKPRKVYYLENPLIKDLTPGYARYFFDPLTK